MFVFDLLYVDGEALVALPLRERRHRLAQALPKLRPGHVQIAESTEFEPAAFTGSTAAAVIAAAAAARAGSADGMEQPALAASKAEAVPSAPGQRSGKAPEAAGKAAGGSAAEGPPAEAVLAAATPPAAQSGAGAIQAGHSFEASQAADRPSPSDAAAGTELVPAAGLQALEARIQARQIMHCALEDQVSSACAAQAIGLGRPCTAPSMCCLVREPLASSRASSGFRTVWQKLHALPLILHSAGETAQLDA